MKLSRKEQWIVFGGVNVVLLLALLFIPLYLQLASRFPIGECALYKQLGVYCPACGGTRAMGALIRFELLDSLRYNPLVPIGALVLVAYESFMLRYLIKNEPRPLFFKKSVAIVLIGAWVVYLVARNVLLVFGIDLLGNIIG